jgi:hypothetical protein
VLRREVTFSSGGAQLSGTLILPASAGRHRAVLCLHGSGPEGRWANRYLAQKFAEADIAAIYDKRGVGQSDERVPPCRPHREAPLIRSKARRNMRSPLPW